jgi:hypothetical protein
MQNWPTLKSTFGGSVNDAGQSLLNCAVAAGFGTQTHVHGVGDGAFWIADQIHAKFGSQASYLVDFFHVCDYLAAASNTCLPSLLVAACKHKSQDLQTSAISARIICEYLSPSTRIKCEWADIICKQPANIAQGPQCVQTRKCSLWCFSSTM